MSEEILRTYIVPVERSMRIVTSENGDRHLYDGASCVATEGDDQVARCARFVLAIRDLTPGAISVAHIGGGFCITARLLGDGFGHTIYEKELDLARFAPEGATFVPGDWRETFKGSFDVVIVDTGDSLTDEDCARFGMALVLVAP